MYPILKKEVDFFIKESYNQIKRSVGYLLPKHFKGLGIDPRLDHKFVKHIFKHIEATFKDIDFVSEKGYIPLKRDDSKTFKEEEDENIKYEI